MYHLYEHENKFSIFFQFQRDVYLSTNMILYSEMILRRNVKYFEKLIKLHL